MHSTSVLSLPLEALAVVCKTLSPLDLKNTALVCRLFNSAASDNLIWKTLLQNDFPEYFIELLQSVTEDVNYKMEYANACRIEYKGLSKLEIEMMTMVKNGLADKILNLKFSSPMKLLKIYLKTADSSGRTLMEWAAIKNNQSVRDSLYQLIENTFSKDIKRHKYDLLKFAIMCQQPVTTLEKLCKKMRAADLPLAVAAKYGTRNHVVFMLDQGAEINGHAFDYFTPLCSAAEGGNPEIVSLLLDRGANIAPDQNNSAKRALDIAVKQGKPEIVSILTDRGVVNDEEETPQVLLLCARAVVDAQTVAKELLELDRDVTDAVIRCCVRLTIIEAISVFHQLGIEINPDDISALTNYLIERCILQSNMKHLKLIINLGIDVDSCILPGGTTLLMMAVIANKLEVVEVLLNAGANPLAEAEVTRERLQLMQGVNNEGIVSRTIDLLERAGDAELINLSILDMSILMGFDEITSIINNQIQSHISGHESPTL